MHNIFIMGSKGIPSNYGGFETFVDELISRRKNKKIQYYVSCLSDENKISVYNEAICLHIKTPKISSATAVLYDLLSLNQILNYIEKNKVQNPIIYILACRIGPFLRFYKNRIKKNNVRILLNPDGNEWKRSKWPFTIRKYWKFSEKIMLKHADLVVCDSKGIEAYIKKEYGNNVKGTTYIAYGSETVFQLNRQDEVNFENWKTEKNISDNEYYLVVGRFVPENNYELIIKEFMKTKSKKRLVIITNHQNSKYFNQLLKKTNFDLDKRITFVGTVYNKSLLYLIRKNCFAYLHGHSVGGTNPSLLEALSTTKLNILFDVSFNREVGEDSCLYFSDKVDNLKNLIDISEEMSEKELGVYNIKSSEVINNRFTWDFIVNEYENLFERQYK